MNHTAGTVTWLGLLQTYVHHYWTSFVLYEVARWFTQIRQKIEKDKNTYGDRAEEYAAECSSVNLDDMLVSYYVQGVHSTTQSTVTEAPCSMYADQRSTVSNLFGLAQPERKMSCARTALCDKTSSAGASWRLVVLIAISLSRKPSDYSIGQPTPGELYMSLSLPVRDGERYNGFLLTPSYRTAGD